MPWPHFLFRLQSILAKEVEIDPCRSQQQLALALGHYGVAVERDYVQRSLEHMGISYKAVSNKNELKFSMENIIYYADYMSWVRSVPWIRLKFMDECSFESRSECLCVGSICNSSEPKRLVPRPASGTRLR